jgi:EpsI family protein
MTRVSWTPATILLLGTALVLSGRGQRDLDLRAPLSSTVPELLASYASEDLTMSEAELRVTGVSQYLARVYQLDETKEKDFFTLYVGYYESQRNGKTIHSPRNCLPGSGWEPLVGGREVIATADGAVEVNRYVLQRGEARALVLYWYQGRGRVEASEYAVKWDLLRDAALLGRSDEALVRLMVPINGSEQEATRLAVRAAEQLIPAVQAALPT